MFDMKPDAPDDIRSPYQSIQSAVPGLPVCEHLPRMAKIMDRVTIIRSVHHKMKHHNSAGYYALSGHEPQVMIKDCGIYRSSILLTVVWSIM